jgi:uncharacterized membrane protein
MLQLFAAKPFLIGWIGFLVGVLVTLTVVWVVLFRKYGRS